MSTFLKKNWFVCLLAVAFASMSVFYIYDTNKGKLKGKSVNGEDVVYSIGDEDVTTSEFYDSLYQSGGISTVASLFQKAVVNQAVEETTEMKTYANTQGPIIEQNYMYQYPTTYKDVLGTTLKSLGYSGYDDLKQYLIDYQKLLTLAEDYAKENFDDLQIRHISYILVKFSDDSEKSATANEDESSRMQAVDDALASGDSFATVATNYSEDSSTASSGGELGTIDKNTSNLDSAFLEAALSLKEGETSDWVYSSNFGFFRIRCNAASADTLEEFVNTPTATPTPSASATAEATASPTTTVETITETVDPYESLLSSDTTITPKAIFAKAEELGMDFGDNTELETALKTYYGIEE